MILISFAVEAARRSVHENSSCGNAGTSHLGCVDPLLANGQVEASCDVDGAARIEQLWPPTRAAWCGHKSQPQTHIHSTYQRDIMDALFWHKFWSGLNPQLFVLGTSFEQLGNPFATHPGTEVGPHREPGFHPLA